MLIHWNQIQLINLLKKGIITIRQDEILSLVKSINALAVLFKELSVLVEEQTVMVDKIDAHIEEALKQTKKGNEELRKV